LFPAGLYSSGKQILNSWDLPGKVSQSCEKNGASATQAMRLQQKFVRHKNIKPIIVEIEQKWGKSIGTITIAQNTAARMSSAPDFNICYMREEDE
jgi:hypothetical protein